MGLASTRHTILRALLSGIWVAGVAPVFAQSTEPVVKNESNDIKIDVGSGVDVGAHTAEAYALVELVDQSWKITSVSRKMPEVTDPEKQELLVFAKKLQLVEPVYSKYYWYLKNQKYFQDTRKPVPYDPYVCFSGEKKDRPSYSPCDSKLTTATNLGKAMIFNIAGAAASLGMSLASQGTGSYVAVDREKVLTVLKETNALEVVGDFVKLARYREAFERSKTVEHYRLFIEKYRDADPDGLVVKAEAKVAELEGAENARRLEEYRKLYAAAKSSYDLQAFIQRYESNDPDNLVPKARQGLKVAEREERRQAQEVDARAKKMAAAEAEHRQRAASALASWRGKLRIGDDTFCGPVIELRQPMIKIAIRAQLPGYATETWLKAGEVFPPDYGCENINGRLRPVG